MISRLDRRALLPLCGVSLALVASGLPQASKRCDAAGGNPYTGPNTNYGVSGGNVNDISRLYCCSGTLGSLVTNGTTNYILSNNHILARGDQATAGEDISQPGLVDNSCRVPPIVADFSAASQLGSNVDAAVAQLKPGAMNTTGYIEGIGTISSAVKAASPGLTVTKSGRTTGTTTGTISSVNTSVSVQYQKSCGQGKKFVVSYTNQVVVTGSTFSAGGDSGSLIVSNNSPTCHQPVALLFAGSSSTTIGNPIGEVLSKVGAALGSSVSFVGTNCTASATTLAAAESNVVDRGPSDQAIAHASTVLNTHLANLMKRFSIIGAGVGATDVDPSRAAIVVYSTLRPGMWPPVARVLDGVPVKVIYTDPFIAR